MDNNQSESDFYATLEIDPAAGGQEVRSAYLELARRHHPDLNQDRQAARRRFQEIVRAYEVLSDPVRRRQYDVSRKKVGEVLTADRTVFGMDRNDGRECRESTENYFWPGSGHARRSYPSGLVVATVLFAAAGLSAGLLVWSEPPTQLTTRVESRQQPANPKSFDAKNGRTDSGLKRANKKRSMRRQKDVGSPERRPIHVHASTAASHRENRKRSSTSPSPLIAFAQSVTLGHEDDNVIAADPLAEVMLEPSLASLSKAVVPNLPRVDATSRDMDRFHDLQRGTPGADPLWPRHTQPAAAFPEDLRPPVVDPSLQSEVRRKWIAQVGFSPSPSFPRGLPLNRWNTLGTFPAHRLKHSAFGSTTDQGNAAAWTGTKPSMPPVSTSPSIRRLGDDDRATFDPYSVLNEPQPSTGIGSGDNLTPFDNGLINW